MGPRKSGGRRFLEGYLRDVSAESVSGVGSGTVSLVSSSVFTGDVPDVLSPWSMSGKSGVITALSVLGRIWSMWCVCVCVHVCVRVCAYCVCVHAWCVCNCKVRYSEQFYSLMSDLLIDFLHLLCANYTCIPKGITHTDVYHIKPIQQGTDVSDNRLDGSGMDYAQTLHLPQCPYWE